MPQYRIEISPNNRAGCKDSVCNKEKIKITKGEIRFGTWVEIQEHGSWAWKHWGCVSGSQLQNLKDECDKENGEYDFEAIDGYDESEDADVQEKVRRCVKQAHIDPEDFKGDPEKNKPGEKGIHLTAKQKAAKEAAAAAENEEVSEVEKPRKAAKRSRKNDEAADEPKAKKAKAAKAAKPEKKAAAAVTKPRGKKAFVKKHETESEEEEEAEGKEEEEEEEAEEPAPKMSKAAAKAAESKSSAKPKIDRKTSAKKGTTAADEDSADDKPATKSKGRRTSGRASRAQKSGGT